MGVCLAPLLTAKPWHEEGMPWMQEGCCWVHGGHMAQPFAGWLGWGLTLCVDSSGKVLGEGLRML
jgi:hypothetical protein